MPIECPVCGSANMKKIISREMLKGDFGKYAHYKKISYKCLECESESEGDSSKENEDAINFALASLKKEYINLTLNCFIDNNISFSSVERILNLPQKTLANWKNGVSQPTEEGIVLLKFLRVFPWLLNVAEHSFDYDTSQKLIL
jgi:transposase-like protein